MPLVNARVGYITIRNTLVTLLKTNVAILASGLTNAIVAANIKAGDPFNEPVPNALFPAVYVRFEGRPEELEARLGGNRKQASFTYKIFCMTRIMSSISASDDEAVLLADSVEAVIRDNRTISSGVMDSALSGMELFIGQWEDKGFISIAVVNLTCTKLVE